MTIKFKCFKEEGLKLNPEEEEEEIVRSVASQLSKVLNQFDKNSALLDHIEQQEKGNENRRKILKQNIDKLNSETLRVNNELQELCNENENLNIKVDLKKKEIKKKQQEIPHVELEELNLKKITLEEELEFKKNNMKIEYASYKIRLNYYKKNFGCYVSLEEPNIVTFEFEERRERTVQSQYFVKLSTPDNGETFKLIDIQPKVENKKQLAEELVKTNNVTNLLVYLRKQFKPLMEKK